MKKIYTIFSGFLLLSGMFLSSCIDDSINRNPGSVDENKVNPEWLLNASIGGAQMNPHIAERMFIYDWMNAARFQRASGFTLGADNNGYTTDYLSISYAGGWIRDASKAVQLADDRVADGTANGLPYLKNVGQMARVWRAYLLSEIADNVGSIPTVGIGLGDNPVFQSQETVYTYILDELKDATSKLDATINMEGFDVNQDQIFGGDISKWIKYGNSLRMRIAMQVSLIDPTLAKTHFEEAAKGSYIDAVSEVARVKESSGWNPYTGVFSLSWDRLQMTKTFYNLTVNLGGIEFDVPAELQSQLKDPSDYLGMDLSKHLPLTSNDPTAPYYYDGIPKIVDPRAQKLYSIIGYKDDNGIYPAVTLGNNGIYKPNDKESQKLFNIPLYTENAKDTLLIVNVAYTWNTLLAGVWSNAKTEGNKATMSAALTPSSAMSYSLLSNQYRTNTGHRVFFGPWESNFLLAEAALKGWSVAKSDEYYYERGVTTSFEYMGLGQVSTYLNSTSYNRIGTSVKYTHTTEATSFTAKYLDGYTNQMKTTIYNYPKNSIYNNGATNNDKLTKIITQKFISQVPWLPLQSWNDHRRLGLPFFENQAVETAYTSVGQVPLTPENSTTCDWKFYPKRLRYPASWSTDSPKQYNEAVGFLNGADLTSTPLWWSNK